MKKLLGISALALVLAACSQDQGPRGPQGGQGPNNQALETAMKECHSSTTKGDNTAFETCMKNKGFEKPTGTPPNGSNGQPPKAPNAQ